MNSFGIALRDILDRRKLSQKTAADTIGISATSFSKIVTGKSRPKKMTLGRIIKSFCETRDEEQILLGAYENPQPALALLPDSIEHCENTDFESLVRNYMRDKQSQAILEGKVAAVLSDRNVPFIRNYVRGDLICDFYLPDHKMILQCNAFQKRDWKLVEIECAFISKKLPSCELLVVVPRSMTSSLVNNTDLKVTTLEKLSKKFPQEYGY